MKAHVTTLLVVGLVAGCGGDDDARNERPASPAEATARAIGPKPAESPSDAITRISDAVEAGDCSSPEQFIYGDVSDTQICEQLIRDGLDPAGPENVEAYGSAAIAENTDGLRIILVLDENRRFKLGTMFDADLPERDPHLATVSLSSVIGALRENDCKELARWSLTFQEATGRRFCVRERIQSLRAAVKDGYKARRLGSDGSLVFYGVEGESGQYFTLLFIASQQGGHAFVDSFGA